MPFDAITDDIRLLNAQTVGDVYRDTRFLHVLGELKRPDDFSSFYDENASPRISGQQEMGGDLRPYREEDVPSLSRFAAFHEAAQFIFTHQNLLVQETRGRPLRVDGWHQQLLASMSGRVLRSGNPIISAPTLWADMPINLVVSGDNDTGQMIPHDHTYEVLARSPFASLLQQSLYSEGKPSEPKWGVPEHWTVVMPNILTPDENKLGGDAYAQYVKTRDALLAGAIPIPGNAVVRMTPLTIYQLSPTPPSDQVCLHGFTTYRTSRAPR